MACAASIVSVLRFFWKERHYWCSGRGERDRRRRLQSLGFLVLVYIALSAELCRASTLQQVAHASPLLRSPAFSACRCVSFSFLVNFDTMDPRSSDQRCSARVTGNRSNSWSDLLPIDPSPLHISTEVCVQPLRISACSFRLVVSSE